MKLLRTAFLSALVVSSLIATAAPAVASHFRASFGAVTYDSSSHVLTWEVTSGWAKGSLSEFAGDSSDVVVEDSSSTPAPVAVTIGMPVADETNPLFDVNHETIAIDLTGVLGAPGTYSAYVTSCCRVDGLATSDFSQRITFTVDGLGNVNLGPAFLSPTVYSLIPVDGSTLDLNYEAVDPDGNTPVSLTQLTNSGSPDFGAAPLPCATFTAGHLQISQSRCTGGEDYPTLYAAGNFFAVKVRAADLDGNSTEIDTLLRVPVIPVPFIDDITVTGTTGSVELGLEDSDTVVDSYSVSCVNTHDPSDVVAGTANTSPISLTGLTRGAAYSCSSTATNGLGTGTSSTNYSLLPPSPAVSGITPNTGYNAGGTRVTVSGTGFTGATAVKFGATAASSFLVDSDTSITAITPSAPLSTVDVTVENGAGPSPVIPAGEFEFIATPPSSPGISITAPTGLTVTGGVDSLKGTFIAPVVTGSTLTGYQISLDSGVTWTGLLTDMVNGRQELTVPGLKAGSSYTVMVRGVAGPVVGPASAPASAWVGTPATAPGVERLAGDDRVGTAIAVSQRLFPTDHRAPAVVLATSSRYADSIGGARLASAAGAPLLLTDSTGLRTDIAAEVNRLVAAGGTIYVLGDENALGDQVEDALRALNSSYQIKRLAGSDRFETAVAVANAVKSMGNSGPIYLASGTNFPDGLAVSSLAAQTHGVVLLTDGSTLPAETAAYLKANDPTGVRTVPVGGPAAAALPMASARAIVGVDRYDTARLVAAKFSGGGVTTIGLATGENWPDALSGAAAMGIVGGPLLLTPPSGLGAETLATVSSIKQKAGVQTGWVFGGAATLSDSIVGGFSTAVGK